MRKTGRTNIGQVAQQAGVSIKTISRVINNRPDVSPETRQRVQEIIEKLGYQPNAIAQGLRARQSFTIAYIILRYQTHDMISEPYMAQTISGIVDTLTPAGYYLLTYPVLDNQDSIQKLRSLLLGGRVDGAIIQDAYPDDPLIEVISDTHVPTAYVGLSKMYDDHSFSVTADFGAGTRLALEYLLSKGHTRIAHIQGDLRHESGKTRVVSFRQELQERGLPLVEGWICGGGWSREDGRDAMRIILAQPDHPTAVIAANDFLAIGAMEEIRAQGLSIPQDIAVTGFDDIPLAGDICTPLTTVRTKFSDFGRTAAENLIRLVENPGLHIEPVFIPIKLIPRSSA